MNTFASYAILYGQRQIKKIKNKKWKFRGQNNVGQSYRWPFMGWRIKSGEYTGSSLAFSTTHHAGYIHMIIQYREARVCMVITCSRVGITRVKMPILLVVN